MLVEGLIDLYSYIRLRVWCAIINLFGVNEIADATHDVGGFLLDDTDEEEADGQKEEQQPRPPAVFNERPLAILCARRPAESGPHVESAEHQLEDVGEDTRTVHVEREIRVSVSVDFKLDLADLAV